MNDSYYLKYLKYKNKYLNLQKGGLPAPLPKSPDEILDFIKEITMENSRIRLEAYNEYPVPITEIIINKERYSYIEKHVSKSSSKEYFAQKPIQPIVFSKGIDRMYALMDLLDEFSKKAHNDKFKVFIVAQFIIINQVFSDGNHRSAIYVLTNYGGFNEEQVKRIMDFTERIHSWKGDLHDLGLWELDSNGIYKPKMKELLDNRDISFLFR
jgi:hypothetical protein